MRCSSPYGGMKGYARTRSYDIHRGNIEIWDLFIKNNRKGLKNIVLNESTMVIKRSLKRKVNKLLPLSHKEAHISIHSYYLQTFYDFK